MLTPYLPYPTNSGGQIRSNNLLKHLSKKHEITLCSLIKNPEDERFKDKLKPYCKEIHIFTRPRKPWTLSNILRTGFSSYPFLVMRNFSPDEKNALPKIIEEGNFDLIHAETFYTCPHIPPNSLPLVLVDQTIEVNVYQHFVRNFKFFLLRPMLYIDVLKLKYWETFYWKKAARTIAVSEADAKTMRELVPGLKVTVVPNGVGEDLVSDVPLHYNKTILFMGSGWLQNVEAATILAIQVFPQIQKVIPDVRLILAGQLGQNVQKLKSENIDVMEIAQDDIESVKKLFRSAGVMVTPLYGPGGTRLKILGAMASKLPVVTTKVGIAGIDATNKENVLMGENSQDLARLTINILQDKKLYEKIAKNARKFVEDNYFYEAIAEKLDQVYTEVTNG